MQSLLALERFAEVSAELDTGAPRDVTLRTAGLSIEEWLAIQHHWLSSIAAETTRKRYELANRYNARFIACRRELVARRGRAGERIGERSIGSISAVSGALHAPAPAMMRTVEAPLMQGMGNAAAEGPRLTLAQFASLCAEMAVEADKADQVRARYGFDEASHAREHGMWQWRFDQDKALFTEYLNRFRHYRDWLLGAAAGVKR